MIYNKFIFLFILFTGLFSQDKGQKLFKEKKYNEARKYYESVLDQRDDDKAAMFGLGSSAYYQNDIDAALNSFGNTIDTDNKALRSKSYYNIARILQDKNEIEQSLSFYRKSLELNPSDMDTKINYELLKNQMKQNQKQEDNKNKENNDDQNEESEQNQDQSNKEDENNSQENESNSEQDKNGNKEEDKNEMAENGARKQDEPQTEETDQNTNDQQFEENENKSDELMQAEAILNALKDQEKINQKQKILKTKSFKFDKDW